MTSEVIEKTLRGKGRGSRFFVLGRAVWERLLSAKTSNRLNLILTFLTLLAGTGSDHRLSKWSAKACEECLGLGRPRARLAIQELIAAGLVDLGPLATKLSPQYLLPSIADDEDPIFIPIQAVTGFGGEAPMLRRVRETGDWLVLRMLIDLYGLVQVDQTYGIPLGQLRQGKEDSVGTKISEMGIHAIWALNLDQTQGGSGDWVEPHYEKAAPQPWATFWRRVKTLQEIGALWFEPWLFDGESWDAEPLFPVDFSVLYTRQTADDVAELSQLVADTAQELLEGREYLMERHGADLAVPLPLHHRAPAIRGVAKLRIEADTPGCRMAYARRKGAIERWQKAYSQLLNDAKIGRYDRPLGAP